MKKVAIILLVLLAVLIGVSVLKKQKTTHQYQQPMLFEKDLIEEPLSEDKLQRVAFTLNEKIIELVNLDSGWSLTGFEEVSINQERFNQVLDVLDTMTGLERSSDPALLEDYSIKDDQTFNIALDLKNGASYQFLVASKKPGPGANFIRYAGDSTVYSIDQDLLGALGFWQQDINEEAFMESAWLSTPKEVIKFDISQAISITVDVDGLKTAEIRREDPLSTWTAVKGFPFEIDEQKVKDYLEKTILNLPIHAVESLDVIEEWNWYMTVEFMEQAPVTISRAFNDQGTYIRMNDQQFVYKISPYHYDNLMKDDGDFFVNNPFGIDYDSFQEVKVNDVENKIRFTATRTGMESVKDEEMGEDREAGIWKLNRGKPNRDSLDGVARSLSALRVKALWEDEVGQKILTLNYKDGSQEGGVIVHEMIQLPYGQKCHPTQVSGYDQIFCIQDSSIRSIRNNAKRYLYEEPKEEVE